MNKRLRNDLILLFICLSVGVILFILWRTNYKRVGKTAVVYHGEEVVLELDLYKNQEVSVEGDISIVVIVVNYGKVYVKESGCENQICVHMGEKSLENETITCLPNRITIIIRDGGSNE